MCGRITQHYNLSQLGDVAALTGPARNLRPRYNIAPTTTIDVIQPTEAGNVVIGMRWGLVPVWWKKPLSDLPATFNARAETVAEKPMFRDAYRKRRCIVPASGFYEWTGEKGAKQPHLFTAADGSPVLAFAGLWDRWRDPAGDEVLSCTIIVSGASEWMKPYHDRMPVLLDGAAIPAWLDGSAGAEALRAAKESALRAWPVSTRVNRTGSGDDDATLIEKVAA